MDKKYCVGFNKKYDGHWSIELTDCFNGYNVISDNYGHKQVFDTLNEAVNSVRELRIGKYYHRIGF